MHHGLEPCGFLAQRTIRKHHRQALPQRAKSQAGMVKWLDRSQITDKGVPARGGNRDLTKI
jgi:hypothetical protein